MQHQIHSTTPACWVQHHGVHSCVQGASCSFCFTNSTQSPFLVLVVCIILKYSSSSSLLSVTHSLSWAIWAGRAFIQASQQHCVKSSLPPAWDQACACQLCICNSCMIAAKWPHNCDSAPTRVVDLGLIPPWKLCYAWRTHKRQSGHLDPTTTLEVTEPLAVQTQG